MTDPSYDYNANCRRWPEARGPLPVGTLEVEVTDPIRSAQGMDDLAGGFLDRHVRGMASDWLLARPLALGSTALYFAP